MKTSKLILTIFVLIILASCNRKSNNIDQTVNAVIGDFSFMETFGQRPTNETDESSRLQTHLKYVENLLRSKDISSLTKEQRVNRLKMLDLLNEYWMAGAFPKNYDYPDQRIPCFIDKDGNIWTSAGKAIKCFNPNNELIGQLLLPELVSNLEFGGKEGNILYVTATSSLYKMELNQIGAKFK